MSKYLYKYAGPGFIDKIFAKADTVTLKCGYPAEFNDPYELFLTMDFKEDPGPIAFYADVIGKLPQHPTTCFSRSPSVIPMWAHYANNLQGFALEVDEEKLQEYFPESGFGDVNYEDEPSKAVASHLYRAYEIGKFRYMHFLRQSVFSAAYFTKQLCWAYEMERRMVLDDSEGRNSDGMTLLDLPSDCITSIICGPRALEETVNALRGYAETIGCRFYQMKIGRSSGIPFFLIPETALRFFLRTRSVRRNRIVHPAKSPLTAALNCARGARLMIHISKTLQGAIPSERSTGMDCSNHIWKACRRLIGARSDCVNHGGRRLIASVPKHIVPLCF